jgi:hypothetical protein
MAQSSKFVMFQRGDGSTVGVQATRVLYVAKGENATVLNFGAGTQVNVRGEFDDVIAALDAAGGDDNQAGSE